MNLKKLHNLFLIGIALCSCFSYAQNIDNQEVQDLIVSSYESVKKLLMEHQYELENLAKLLLKKEVVYLEDLEEILGKRTKEIPLNAKD